MTLQLHIATHSEVGPVRKNNQDSGYASPHLLVVADGMGGAAAGDLASAVAVDTIRAVDGAIEGGQMLEVLGAALHRANDRIADLVDDDYALEGMGTTVTGVLFDGSQLGLAHIGDSRAYLLHDRRLERLTHDHSWVQSLVDDGKISERDAAVHPHRSLLLKVLNGQPANEPDLTMVKVVAGDRLLICSDGLCGLVDDPVIEAAMLITDLDDALRQLVDEALAEGGIDNITVVLADVMETAEDAAPVTLGAAAERVIPVVRSRRGGQTHEIPEVETDPGGGEAEDTLVTGTSGRPTDDGDQRHADQGSGDHGPRDDEARYSPQPPHRRRFVRPLVGVLVLALVVGAGLSAAFAWTRTQYFVAASSDRVAIFQGLSDSLPGIPLSRLYEVQPLTVNALPPYYQERVRSSIEVASLAAARQTVNELSDAAKRCADQPSKPAPPASVSPSPRSTVAPSASATAPDVTSTAPPSVRATSASTLKTGATPSARPSVSASPSVRASASASALPDLNC